MKVDETFSEKMPSQQKVQHVSGSRMANALEESTNKKAIHIFPEHQVRRDLPLDVEAKKLGMPEKFKAIAPQTSQQKPSPIEALPKHKSRSEKMLEKLETHQDMTLRELMFQIGQIQTSITADLERVLGSHFLNMVDRNQGQSDDLADAQKSKWAPFLIIAGGVLGLLGAGLGAAHAVGTTVPLIPAMLKTGDVLTKGGAVVNSVGEISTRFNQAEQQKLRHLYDRSVDRMRDIERVRNQANQEKKQALQRLIELEQTYQRLIQDLLTR